MKRLILLVVLGACGGDPVNAEGTYSLNMTRRTNGCNFENWNEGEQFTNIEVVINQEGSSANADVMGGTRSVLDFLLGSHIYNGSVDGDELDLTILGTRSFPQGNCTLTVDSDFLGTLDGDVMTGRIEFHYHGNGNPDCAPYDGCTSFFEMNGTRPPQ